MKINNTMSLHVMPCFFISSVVKIISRRGLGGNISITFTHWLLQSCIISNDP